MSTPTAARAPAPPARRPWWPPAAVALGSALVVTAGLLVTTDLRGVPAPHATPATVPPGLLPAEITLAGDPPPPGSTHPGVRPGERLDGAVSTDGRLLAGAERTSPEGRLIAIYHDIAAGRLDRAVDRAAALTREVPTFRLAQLVYADLLTVRAGPAEQARVAAALGHADPATTQALADLRAEAALRLRALRERPPAGAVPSEFLVLPKAVHHAIAVDTSRARLYLFENTDQGLRLVSDHYVTIGKQGVGKSVEGDERTPLGVYFVSDRIGGQQLQKRFGAGALALNYPNAFDHLAGRTGHGIYVHGVPSTTYSRPPKDSDGCIAMANDELLATMNMLPMHDVPVIITRHLHWTTDAAAVRHRTEILSAVNRWEDARARGDTAALAAFYAPGVTEALPPPAGAVPVPARATVRFDDLSVLTWHDERETMVVTFHERQPPSRREAVLRQYWERRPDSRWAIVAEGRVR